MDYQTKQKLLAAQSILDRKRETLKLTKGNPAYSEVRVNHIKNSIQEIEDLIGKLCMRKVDIKTVW